MSLRDDIIATMAKMLQDETLPPLLVLTAQEYERLKDHLPNPLPPHIVVMKPLRRIGE